MKRIVYVTRGYDCRVKCGHEPPGKHGWHGDEIDYVVQTDDQQAAVSLCLSTGRLGELPNESPPEATSVALHLPFPIEDDAIRNAAGGRPCDWIATGKCFGTSWSLYARELFALANGRLDAPASTDVEQQPESLWRALEEFLVEQYARLEVEWKGKERCPECGGRGVV